MALKVTIKNNIMVTEPRKYDTHLNVGKFLLDKLASRPGDFVVMVDSLTGNTLTVRTLLKNSVSVAEWLRSKGMGPGQTVGICAENRLEYMSVILGTLAIGATCATYNPVYTAGELVHTMLISNPRIIFCTKPAVQKVKTAAAQLPQTSSLVVFGDENTEGATVTAYNDVIKYPASVENFQAQTIDTENTVAVILCSSGTTGLPKGVELTHSNVMCWSQTLTDSRVTGAVSEQDILLGLPPFFHGYGFGLLCVTLTLGFQMVAVRRFTEEHFLETVQKYKVTLLFVVPPVLLLLAKHPLVSKYDLSSIRMIRCGAAPLSKEIHTAVAKRLKIKDIGQAYGMTEVSIACVFVPKDCTKVGSVGIICPGMECKIVEVESGKSLRPYKKGEVCFRGPFVMKGYRKNVKATKETIDKEGWLHTGDIGYYDPDGYMYIVDRLKELIKFKGFQVAPAELEAVLLTHIAVKEAAVIGIPDEKAGELPFAFVIKQPSAQITAKELQKYVAEKVSPQKRLRGGIRFVEEIPKNSTGKILRRELRLLFQKTSKL